MQLAEVRAGRSRALEPRLTKAQVAGHFSVSVRTITRWMSAGMPYDKPYEGGVPRFSLRECEAWFSHRR